MSLSGGVPSSSADTGSMSVGRALAGGQRGADATFGHVALKRSVCRSGPFGHAFPPGPVAGPRSQVARPRAQKGGSWKVGGSTRAGPHASGQDFPKTEGSPTNHGPGILHCLGCLHARLHFEQNRKVGFQQLNLEIRPHPSVLVF